MTEHKRVKAERAVPVAMAVKVEMRAVAVVQATLPPGKEAAAKTAIVAQQAAVAVIKVAQIAVP